MQKQHLNNTELLIKYRKASTINSKVKILSKLTTSQKNKFVKQLTSHEIAQYKKHASILIEKRFECVNKNRKCLNALTSNNPNISDIKNKYMHIDLSIPIYTIKAIINTYEGIGFSRDDGRYSSNSRKYYVICKKYWEKIIRRWDTDTGILSKEQIEKKQFSDYHKNANKVKTIIKQLELYTPNYRFLKKYEPKLPEWKKWYHISNGHKSRIGGPEDFQMFLHLYADVL